MEQLKAKQILLSKFGNQFKDYVGEDQMWILDNIIEAMKEYANQFITSANEIIDPALEILPETYDEEIQNWIKIQHLQDEK